MGKKSRDKGARLEREVVALLKNSGRKARRTAPLQTYEPNNEPDIDSDGLRIEVKGRRNGFIQIYEWLEGNDWLVLKANGKPFLVVKKLEDELESLLR